MSLVDRLAPWIVGLITLLAAAVVTRVRPPAALAHDEFSYLLAAETFAAGRWSLPPPPSWEHFETMHVLVRPSRASKYPPGQGLALALGTRLGGRPIVGAWLATAAAAAAIGWMLAGWLGTPRAAWGGLAFGLHPSVLLGWANTYWGGSLAAAGGALLFGALPRIVPALARATSTERAAPARSSEGSLGGALGRAGLALGTGLGLLVLTRPFEGALAALPVAAVLAWGLVRGVVERARAWRWLAPAGLLLAGALLVTGLHARAVTGSAWRLPYAEYHARYEVAPLFVFQPPAEPPEYRHAVLRDFFTRAEASVYHERRSWIGFLAGTWRRLGDMARFFGAWGLLLFAAGLWLARRERAVRVAAGSVALGIAAVVVETFGWPHYLAPFVAPAAFLLVRSAQRLWAVGGAARIVVALAGLAAAGEQLPRALAHARTRAGYAPPRDAVIADLEARGGKHLVLVRYAADHNPHVEWVYDPADLQAAPVVWAREMGAERDRELLAAFPDRSAWILAPDRDPRALVPYPERPAPLERATEAR